MKKILFTVALIVSATAIFAQWQNNNNRGPNNNQNNRFSNAALVVNSNSQSRFMVRVDNEQYQSSGASRFGNSVNVGSLNAGYHTITVYEWRSGFFGKQKQRVIYSSNLYFKPNMETTLSINDHGRVFLTERKLFQNGNDRDGGRRGYGKDRNDDHGKYKREEDRRGYNR